LFGWPPAYLYEWVDGLQDWFAFSCELLETNFGATCFLFCSGSSLRLWSRCQTYLFIYILLKIVAHLCMRFENDLVMHYDAWLLRYLVWWYSAASFWEHSYACFIVIPQILTKVNFKTLFYLPLIPFYSLFNSLFNRLLTLVALVF